MGDSVTYTIPVTVERVGTTTRGYQNVRLLRGGQRDGYR